MSNVVEVRTVKINLKKFTEDLLFAHLSDDEDEVSILEVKFEHVFHNSSTAVKNQILNFLSGCNLVKENKLLTKYFKKFTI